MLTGNERILCQDFLKNKNPCRFPKDDRRQEEILGYIYKLTDKRNKKIYVGQRFFDGNPIDDISYFGSGIIIKSIRKKYGNTVFEKSILESNINDAIILNEREMYWIKKLDSTNSDIGYNISPGGQDIVNWRENASKEKLDHWKEKISENHADVRGEKNGMYGKSHSVETRKKISQSRKELHLKLSQEHKDKISRSLTGRKCPKPDGYKYVTSEETKKKISLSNKGKKRTTEQRKNISSSMIGRKMSKEANEKFQEGSKKFWENISPEEKEKVLKKRSDSLKKRYSQKGDMSKEMAITGAGKRIKIRVKNIETGLEKDYNSITEFCKENFGEWKRSYHEKIKKAIKNFSPYNGFLFFEI